MEEHVRREIERTGADIVLKELGFVLAKGPSRDAIEMRLGVDYATALYARQPHVDEPPGEKTRSWPIVLDRAPALPAGLVRGLTEAIEEVARLQGRDVPMAQGKLDL